MLDAFAGLDPRKHVVFMGFGELEDAVKEFGRTHPNIHFHEAVSPEKVPMYTSGADVGICLTENTCLNHFLSLPNKVFEYIMNGVPLIVSDFPEMGRVVDEAECGWKVAVNKNALRSLLTAITRDEIIEKRNHTMQYRKTIGWENEESVLLRAYRDAIGKGVR